MRLPRRVDREARALVLAIGLNARAPLDPCVHPRGSPQSVGVGEVVELVVHDEREKA